MNHEVLERILDGRENPTNLSLPLLKDITENFSEDREIGHGGFATVYKGVLPNGNVAVKRIKSCHSIKETLFYREVNSLLNIEHENVVRFLGFCASTDQIAIQIEGLKERIYAEVRERLLCFEYISNGSLTKYITDELRGLEWKTRYEIIRGICEGLYHLHKEKQIYHMDMKPDNILLDNDMVPKITDFGLSRLDEMTQTMSKDRLGSLGYCAPEYWSQGKMSFKSDMYSLGVIIIELVTGQKALPINNNKILRRWRHRWRKTGKETQLVYQQVAKCIRIGLLCQEIDPSERPFIWDIIDDIRQAEGVNGSIKNDSQYKFGQISPYLEDDDMLGIEPLELHFPFQLNKQMSCTIQLTNETGSYIAFNVEHMNPLSYCAQPQKDIIPPRSKCNVEITMQPQAKAPRDHTSEFTVWSTKVNDGLAIEDMATIKFIKEAINVVDDVNLDVAFDISEPQEASEKTSVTVQPLTQITDDVARAIWCMDAHQTEPLIITGHRFGDVQIWNSDTQKVVDWVKASEEAVSNVKFIARMRWLVAVAYDCFFHVYKYEKELEKVTSFKAHGYYDWGRCSLDVHPTQPYVLSACRMQVKLWDWDQDWNCIQTFEEHSDNINEVKFNLEDTNSFASASDDCTVKVWSLDSPKSKYTLPGHSHHVYSVDFFKRDGRQYLISGCKDKTAKIWDLQKKECVQTLQHECDVNSVFAHPSLPLLVTGGEDGAVRVWSSTDFRLKRKLGVSMPVRGFACLTGSERVAIAHYYGMSVMEIGDEEGQGGNEGSHENSTAAIDYEKIQRQSERAASTLSSV
uniref:Protein kinase domain-containing protein n=1 Tax=Aegilops tauschii subsp. strangulata TaxID=200361 RepID=A0A453T9W8_AEGTS